MASSSAHTLLVVEDDADIREVMQEVLELEGFTILTARTGDDALKALRGQRADLILLDLMMPGMSGWEFLATRAQDPGLRPIPVIIVSAVRDDKVRAAEAVAFLKKPVDLDALIRTVREALK